MRRLNRMQKSHLPASPFLTHQTPSFSGPSTSLHMSLTTPSRARPTMNIIL